MVASTKRTTANGNVIKYDADDGSATVRRVAAALPRDAGVDRIKAHPLHDATVWFDGTPAAESYHVGNYVDIVDVWVSDGSGKVAVTVNL